MSSITYSHPVTKILAYSLGGAVVLSTYDVLVRNILLRCFSSNLDDIKNRLFQEKCNIWDWKSYVNGGLCIGFMVGLCKAQCICPHQ